MEIKLAKKAPKSNIIRQVIEQKTLDQETGKRCIYKALDYSFTTENKYSIMSKNSAIGLFMLFNSFKSNNIIWLNAAALYETNLFFYLRKGDKNGKHLKWM